jgi:hypothetical protein
VRLGAHPTALHMVDGDSTGTDNGEFDLSFDGTTSATTSIHGFEAGSVANAHDVLDFSAFEASREVGSTDGIVTLARATVLTALASALADAELILFRSGAASTAETLEAVMAVGVNSDMVSNGSVNDLLNEGDRMLFAVRTTDASGDDMVNVWRWADTDDADNGSVQAGELTLVASLYGVSMTQLVEENFRVDPVIAA